MAKKPPRSTKVRAQRAPGSRKRKPGKGPSRAKGKKRRAADGPLRRVGRALLRSTAVALGAAALGGGLVLFGLFHQAESQVQDALAGELWDRPGKVYSAPVEIWPGLAASPEELAVDLQSAGYARVGNAKQPGDFTVTADSLLVMRRAHSGPGWDLPESQVLITFRDGRVHTTSPSDPAVLPPAVLASVRGADNEARTPRALEDFPKELRDAVLAMEDARFYEHQGVSFIGVLRALLINAREGSTVQGGSTLTQQVAKNLFLTQERTLSRKGNEALLAFALERELDKDEILALYLNEIYWGQAGGVAICGADEASRAYFGKPVDRLELGEAATLAGIISSPNRYSPLRHPERATERRDVTLRRMADVGWLDPDVAAAEQAKPLAVQPGVAGRRAPYAVDAAIDATEDALGQGAVAEQGLAIHTSIHPPLQRLAEDVVALSVARLEEAYPQTTGVQIALVAVRVDDGAVVALVGGRDYGESQFNRALLAERAAGSTVKPLTALLAMDADPAIGPATRYIDEPMERIWDGQVWTPNNYDGAYLGELSLRQVIAKSRNVPAVLLAEQVGWTELQRGYQSMGLEGASKLPSASLGAFEVTPVQLAGAYTVFPGEGVYAEPTLLRAVIDDAGVPLVNNEPIPMRRASERSAALATSMLQSVMQEGTGARARQFGARGTLGGKSGTTDDYRDAWFVGFTPELSVAVWVGFDQGGSTTLGGSKAALPTWSRFMAGTGTAHGGFELPASVVEAEYCLSDTFDEGLCTECATELFSAGQEPENGCTQPLLRDLWELVQRRDQERPADPDEPPKKRRFRFRF
jgi:penicillin-binding protein 1B